jgi:hypothetical protein
MSCWVQDKWVKYQIIGDNIVLDGDTKIKIADRKGKVFAGRMNLLDEAMLQAPDFLRGQDQGTPLAKEEKEGWSVTVIADYENRRVTVISAFGQKEVTNCER